MSEKHFTSKDLVKYEGHYSEKAFWEKIRRIAFKAGAKVVYYALVLFYTLTDPDTPLKYKTVIAGALGYLILPVDVLPDILPFAGLADDWAALIAAVSYVISAISEENKEKAKQKVRSLFPQADNSDWGDLG